MGISFEIVGENNFPTENLTIPDIFTPKEREYQAIAMKTWMRLRNGIIKASTRAGKTPVFGHIAKALIEEQPNIKIAFLTESKDIFNQNKKEIAKFIGAKVGEVVGSKFDTDHNVTCVMAQTVDAAFRLRKREKGYRGAQEFRYPDKAAKMTLLLKKFDMVCVDECHKFIGTQRRKVIQRFSSARYLLGLSATPFKKSDPINSHRMYGILGGEVYKIGEKKLRKNKILTTDEIVFIKAKNYKNTLDYQSCYTENIIHSKDRMKYTMDIVDICKELGLKLLIFVDRIEHGELYAEAIGCEFVHGGHSDEDRQKYKSEFLEMEGGVLVSSSIFLAGVSFTEVDCTIALAGGLEETRQQQRRGRALGVGKRDRSMTFDFLDEEPKYLRKHSYARMRAYENQSEGLKANKLDLSVEGKKEQLKKHMIKWFKL